MPFGRAIASQYNFMPASYVFKQRSTRIWEKWQGYVLEQLKPLSLPPHRSPSPVRVSFLLPEAVHPHPWKECSLIPCCPDTDCSTFLLGK